MLNLLVMKYEGNKPDINDYVEYIDNKTVRKWKLSEMSMVIGVRVPTAIGYNLLDDEILIQLQSCIGNLDIEEPQSLYTTKEPLFTSTDELKRFNKNIQEMNDNMVVFCEKLNPVMQKLSKILTACGYCAGEDIINEPLFTSTVDERGRITIREDVRDRKNIDTGDKINVFKLEKKNNKNL